MPTARATALLKETAKASSVVLGGFRLRTEAKLVRYPNRYQDERHRRMWDAVLEIISEFGEPASSSSSSLIYVPPDTPDTLDTPDTPWGQAGGTNDCDCQQ